MRRAGISLLTAIALSTGGAAADWTATGAFRYVDRKFDHSGFTGVEIPLPVRFADVEIVDSNAPASKAVIARGATDAGGAFSIFVSDSKVRDVYARVVTTSDEMPDLNVDVRDGTGSQADPYAGAGPVVVGHDPGVNVAFGTVTLQIGQGGEPFNIYDQLVKGADYVAFLTGSRPSTHLPVAWSPDNGVAGSFYSVSSGRIILRDSAGYDDTVVLHEMGHFVNRQYSATSTTSDTHTFAWCNLDLRLAFDEGWASFFGNSALRFHGEPLSNIYTRTNGGPGPGNLVRSADMENDQQYLCSGATSEVNIFTVLWDIVDGPSTPDTTPGVEDFHDLLDLDDREIWEVFTDYLPGAGTITMETFWDGWFLPPVQNGFLPEMIAISSYVDIEYFEDGSEVNDTVATATPVTPGTPGVHATFFRDPDLEGAGAPDDDYFSFVAVQGETYIIETLALVSDGNTKMYLIDTDGTTVLAIHDDRSSSDESSVFEWTAPSSGTYFVRVFHALDWGIYGSYDFRINPLSTVDLDLDGYISSLDCDDTDPNINPGAAEVCNLVDDNCNLQVDEGFDADLDGFSSCAGDCDDGHSGIHPNASEVPSNGLDDNCNGLIDEGATWFGTSLAREALDKTGLPQP